MKDVIFREYDIRGKVDSELIVEQVYDLTRAIAYYFAQHNPNIKIIAVGMDGRTHSPAIKKLMCQALADSGLDVVFVGICPSPALYFALHTLPVDGGLMITASHNTKEYNGIKICLGTTVVWGAKIREIRDIYKAKKYIETNKKGSIKEHSIIDSYVAWLTNHFQHLIGMQLSVIIDCGNGAAGTVLPQLIQAMGWPNVQLLYAEVDGTYPNHEADPVIEKNMREVIHVVQTTGTMLGIGLDGDCDRMAPVTKMGILVPGDQLLAVLAKPIVQKSSGANIVFDIKSSSGLIELLEEWGAVPCMSPSGHAIIKDKMKESSALLGGELSCHFFFNDRYFGYDDGIYATLRLFELLQSSGKSLDELVMIFPKKHSSREFRISCDENKKVEIVAAVTRYFVRHPDANVITIDGVRATMPYGWGIVRASNTQSALSVRFESDTSDGLQRIKKDFMETLQVYFDRDYLYETFNT